MKQFNGSGLALVFWIIVFFPIAIVYWAVKQGEVDQELFKEI